VLWIVIVASLAGWNVMRIRQADEEKNLEAARALFDIIVTTREWNSRLGGVYVPVSAEIQPNPHLDVPDRDVQTTDGVSLTKINPAYMTRLIGELAQENNNVTYHITSLNPIRPGNAPNNWEADALQSFEEQTPETYEWDDESDTFRYMAPLYVKESCLACHAQQGYQLGDVRGGISVAFPVQPVVVTPTLLGYLGIGTFGLIIILIAGTQLVGDFGKLEQQTEIDGLTQINNRSYFDATIHREYLRARRINSPLSILICDIDDFKAYNDAYGHLAGDACLKFVAQSLHSVLRRPGDLVARYGGEEFGIIMPETTQEGAHTVAELLRAQIESLHIPHRANRAGKYVTISLGGATFTGGDCSLEKILGGADKALYQAKARGRNMVFVGDDINCNLTE
jgi:diguanylate cyclase (GGDEF)-like protein